MSNGGNTQTSIYNQFKELKTNPDADGKKKILNAFLSEHENQVRKISNLTGYTQKVVHKVIDDYFDKTGARGSKMFADSKWSNPMEVFRELTKTHENAARYGKADWIYYIEAVKIFSDKNPRKKRTDNGWLATIRQFMNGDIRKGNFAVREKKPKKDGSTINNF